MGGGKRQFFYVFTRFTPKNLFYTMQRIKPFERRSNSLIPVPLNNVLEFIKKAKKTPGCNIVLGDKI